MYTSHHHKLTSSKHTVCKGIPMVTIYLCFVAVQSSSAIFYTASSAFISREMQTKSENCSSLSGVLYWNSEILQDYWLETIQ